MKKYFLVTQQFQLALSYILKAYENIRGNLKCL
jgi:hypothetical protein